MLEKLDRMKAPDKDLQIDVLENRERNVRVVGVRRHVQNVDADIRIDAEELDPLVAVFRIQLVQPRDVLPGDRTFRAEKHEDDGLRVLLRQGGQVVNGRIDALQLRPLGRLQFREGGSCPGRRGPDEE